MNESRRCQTRANCRKVISRFIAQLQQSSTIIQERIRASNSTLSYSILVHRRDIGFMLRCVHCAITF